MSGLSRWLGTQVWLGETDSREKIDALFASVGGCRFGLVRIFILWNWVERAPGQWDWSLYDRVFEAAEAHGVGIKATLTANSGPWHVGTPLHLHTHTGFFTEKDRDAGMEYVRRCVERYRDHPALAQWILWNEPYSQFPGEPSDLFMGFFRRFLETRYRGDLDRLNRLWLTGFGSFGEIPHPMEIARPGQFPEGGWSSYEAAICLREARPAWMQEQLRWVRDAVCAADPRTPVCINLTTTLDNHPLTGTDLVASARLVDALGASFHPPWIWKDFHPACHPGLTAVGVRTLASVRPESVEITEMQFGSQLFGTPRPADATPTQIARNILAGLAAGADSVTGWLFNPRTEGFEAGDWSLLNEDDSPSPRSAIIPRIADALQKLEKAIGPWTAPPPDVVALTSPASQIIEDIESRRAQVMPGRRYRESADGSLAFAQLALRHGIPATCQPLIAFLEDSGSCRLAFAGHMLAGEPEDVHALLDWVEGGGCLLFDGLFTRRSGDALLQQPWPAAADRLGLKIDHIATRVDGHPLRWHNQDAGTFTLARMEASFLPEGRWTPTGPLRFSEDGSPALFERALGKGRLIFCPALLAASLACEAAGESPPLWIDALSGDLFATMSVVRPLAGHPQTIALPVHGTQGTGWIILAPDLRDRQGQDLNVRIKGRCRDLWNNAAPLRDTTAEQVFEAREGILILVQK